ncbi:MAG: DUF2167 domain-containing protein [Thermoanaerobaculia bacterium]
MKWLWTLLVLAYAVPAGAAAAAPTSPEMTREEFESKLTYQKGKIELGSGLATLNLGPDFRYLDPDQTQRVLVDLWGNPPGAETLGMILPADVSPAQDGGWGVIVTYDEDGYVDDGGAEKIDYAKLLTEMKEDVHKANEERTKHGYETVEIVGWAEPPRYDRASHKLYWAKDLKFESGTDHTLNYNIRVLGRRGVLVLNAVSGVDQLAGVRTSMQALLPEIEFKEGHRYTDFIPGKDKVAEYGIGALVAGTLAAKAGLFKVLLAGLLAFKKAVLIGIAAIGAFLRKFFKKEDTAPQAPGS